MPLRTADPYYLDMQALADMGVSPVPATPDNPGLFGGNAFRDGSHIGAFTTELLPPGGLPVIGTETEFGPFGFEQFVLDHNGARICGSARYRTKSQSGTYEDSVDPMHRATLSGSATYTPQVDSEGLIEEGFASDAEVSYEEFISDGMGGGSWDETVVPGFKDADTALTITSVSATDLFGTGAAVDSTSLDLTSEVGYADIKTLVDSAVTARVAWLETNAEEAVTIPGEAHGLPHLVESHGLAKGSALAVEIIGPTFDPTAIMGIKCDAVVYAAATVWNAGGTSVEMLTDGTEETLRDGWGTYAPALVEDACEGLPWRTAAHPPAREYNARFVSLSGQIYRITLYYWTGAFAPDAEPESELQLEMVNEAGIIATPTTHLEHVITSMPSDQDFPCYTVGRLEVTRGEEWEEIDIPMSPYANPPAVGVSDDLGQASIILLARQGRNGQAWGFPAFDGTTDMVYRGKSWVLDYDGNAGPCECEGPYTAVVDFSATRALDVDNGLPMPVVVETNEATYGGVVFTAVEVPHPSSVNPEPDIAAGALDSETETTRSWISTMEGDTCEVPEFRRDFAEVSRSDFDLGALNDEGGGVHRTEFTALSVPANLTYVALENFRLVAAA